MFINREALLIETECVSCSCIVFERTDRTPQSLVDAAATNDHGLPTQLRIAQQFDGSEEGIDVEVGLIEGSPLSS